MRTVAVQDSDDDWSTVEEFETFAESAERHGLRTTFYLMMGNKPTALSNDAIAALRNRGHSFGIHHDALEHWEEGEDQNLILEEIIRQDVEKFRQQFGQAPLANRNHALVWLGVDELPRLYEELGVRMELNVHGPSDTWLKYLAGGSRPPDPGATST